MKKFSSHFVLALLIVVLICGSLFVAPPKKAKAYNRNLLCTDAGLVNYNALNTTGIQNFLVSKGSFLKSYSQGGKTAAQIINNASKEYGINPIAVLAMLQKEQSLIYAKDYSQYKLDWAMGYGYTDSVIYTRYKGFANQINYGTWQLRKNYDYWATKSDSVWRVGRTMKIDGTNVTFGNKCTSSQYRYTPHLGTNFMNFFNAWGGNGFYDAKLFYQGPNIGAGASGAPLLPGQTFTLWASFKNTGTSTWYRNGATPVHLGTASPQDRKSSFLGGKNLRGYLVQSKVLPGALGTFKIRMTAPSAEGTYTENFQPVTENVGWMNATISRQYTVSHSLASAQTNGVFLTQGFTKGSSNLSPGQVITIWVKYRNTGQTTWFKNGAYATHLGMTDPRDRKSVFAGNTTRRGYLVQNQVPPGGIGTFKMTLRAPSRRYLPYVEHFQLVTEKLKWFGTDVSWKLKVR